MSEEIKLDPAMQRSFRIDIETFNKKFIYLDSILRQTVVGAGVADNLPPPILMDPYSTAPEYVPSQQIIDIETRLGPNCLTSELMQVEDLKNKERDRQIQSFDRQKKADKIIGYELEHIHRALLKGLNSKIKETIISE